MKTLAKVALAAFIAGGAAVATTAPASAGVGITFGFGSPGYYGGAHSYGRPCWFYRRWDLPAPARCYRDYYGTYGSDIFLDGGFVYRDRDDFDRWDHRGWHDRDGWRGGDWHDRDRDWGRRRDHDRGDWHGGDGERHDGDHWHDHDRR